MMCVACSYITVYLNVMIYRLVDNGNVVRAKRANSASKSCKGMASPHHSLDGGGASFTEEMQSVPAFFLVGHISRPRTMQYSTYLFGYKCWHVIMEAINSPNAVLFPPGNCADAPGI